jgi:hypothetical protein
VLQRSAECPDTTISCYKISDSLRIRRFCKILICLILPTNVPFETIQEFCLGRIMRRIVDRLDATQLDGKVALVFDRDPEFSAKRIRLFNHYLQGSEQARRYLVSIMFADPNIYPGLQCADLLAWETRKDLVQKAGGFSPTKRWRAMFTQMPDYTLDYMGEFWNEGEFDRFLPQVIEGYQPSVSSSPSALPQP